MPDLIDQLTQAQANRRKDTSVWDRLATILQLARFQRGGEPDEGKQAMTTRRQQEIAADEARVAQEGAELGARQALAVPIPAGSDTFRLLTRQQQLREAEGLDVISPEDASEGLGDASMEIFGGDQPDERLALKMQLQKAGIDVKMSEAEKAQLKRLETEGLDPAAAEREDQANRLTVAQTERDISSAQIESQNNALAAQIHEAGGGAAEVMALPDGQRMGVAKALGMDAQVKSLLDAEQAEAELARDRAAAGIFADPRVNLAYNQLEDQKKDLSKSVKPGGDPALWIEVTNDQRSAMKKGQGYKDENFTFSKDTPAGKMWWVVWPGREKMAQDNFDLLDLINERMKGMLRAGGLGGSIGRPEVYGPPAPDPEEAEYNRYKEKYGGALNP